MLKESVCTNSPALPVISRCAAMTGAAALAAAPAAAAAGVRPADPHRAWFDEWCRKTDEVNNHPSGEDAAIDPLNERRWELGKLIATTEAQTLDGLRIQLEWLAEDGADDWCCEEHRKAIGNMLSALDGLAG